MSLLTDIDAITPGEAMEVIVPGTPDLWGSIRRLNYMVGSQSRLRTLWNGGSVDYRNFRPDAGISRTQKASPWQWYMMPFSIPGTRQFMASGYGSETMDLLVWAPRPGTEAKFGAGGAAVPDVTIAGAATIGTNSSGYLYIARQTQDGVVILLRSIDLKTITSTPAAFGIDWTTWRGSGEDRRILAERGDRIMLRLVITRVSPDGVPGLTNVVGALNIAHGHVRWSD